MWGCSLVSSMLEDTGLKSCGSNFHSTPYSCIVTTHDAHLITLCPGRHNFEAPYRRRTDTRCPQWLSRSPHCMNPVNSGCVLSKVVEAVLLIHIHVVDLIFRLWRSLIYTCTSLYLNIIHGMYI